MTKIGLIRVLTSEDKDLLESHGRLIEECFPDLKVVSRCIEDQPKGIFDEVSLSIAIPKILRLGCEFKEMGVKAIVISCAADPGVEELRGKITEIPVIGAGSAVASLCLSLGRKVGALRITEEIHEVIRRILENRLVAEIRPTNIRNTLDLLKPEIRRDIIEAARELKNSKAEVIALACTGYSTIRIAPEIETTLKIPVVDPVIASGLFAWYAVKEKYKSIYEGDLKYGLETSYRDF